MTTLARTRPPFRADHVGSLLRPPELHAARAKAAEGSISQEELREIEDRCIRDVVAMQEGIGLKSITDGDFRRNDWFLDFMYRFEGIAPSGEFQRISFSGGLDFDLPLTQVSAKVRCPDGGIMIEDFAFLKKTTRQTAKVCIPAPAMFYMFVDKAEVERSVYADWREFWDDLGKAYAANIGKFAEVGCTYVQIDDVVSALVSDRERQEYWRGRGLDPETLIDKFIDVNNGALAGCGEGMTAAVHMCRGNYQSEYSGEGGYEMVAERYFNRMNVDAFFLEYDDERSGDFAPLRFMPKDKFVVLGLVTSKRPELEPKDELKRRIDEATAYISLDKLCISPQCGFASTQEGNKLSQDEQKRKLAHIVEVAEEVWGR